MFQCDIGGRRASLYPPQRACNGFCSTGGRPETTAVKVRSSSLRPRTRKRSDFHSDAVGVWIDVGLGEADSKSASAPEGCEPFENRMGERLLEVVSPRLGNLRHLAAKEIVIPRPFRIIVGRRGRIIEPDLYRDQE